MRSPLRHLRNGTFYMLGIVCLAVIGYMSFGWSFAQALYMATITVFAVGYNEVLPIDSDALKYFTIIFIFFGCSGYIYVGGALVNLLIEGQIESTLGKRRMSKTLESIKKHTIICGYGRIGRTLANELSAANHDFVVIDNDPQIISQLAEDGSLGLLGDATKESVLLKAGIERAACIAVVIASDAANVFITLSSRTLNPDLKIIARGLSANTKAKLIQAGANRVILAEHIGAERIAGIILRPGVTDVISENRNLAHLHDELADAGIKIEELKISNDSPFISKTLTDLENEGHSSFLVVSITREDGSRIEQPPLDTVVKGNDTIVLLCHEGTRPVFTEEAN